MSALDNFLAAYFYATDLANQRASKTQQGRANEMLTIHERSFLAHLGLNTDDPTDSDVFDRILELVDNYRNIESEYETLVNYVETIRKERLGYALECDAPGSE